MRTSLCRSIASSSSWDNVICTCGMWYKLLPLGCLHRHGQEPTLGGVVVGVQRKLLVVQGPPVLALHPAVVVVGGDHVDLPMTGGLVLAELVSQGGEGSTQERVQRAVLDVLVASVERQGCL